ncbi:hypothetical protein K438DRAFT_1973963 [Mycena galopus ATCC 62051]|nr:hypothetical protein K438DRAFT_1973963 [Mycena galopus ATCC 62051]
MYKPKNIPKHLPFSRVDGSNANNNESVRAHKCKHESSSGGAIVTQTAYSNASNATTATSTAAMPPDDPMPANWYRIFDAAIEASNDVPPPSCIAIFADLQAKSLSDFKTAQGWLQKAVTTHEKYSLAHSTGTVPSTITVIVKTPNTVIVKMPNNAVMKGATGINLDPAVVVARAFAEKGVADTQAAIVTYLGLYLVRTCFEWLLVHYLKDIQNNFSVTRISSA